MKTFDDVVEAKDFALGESLEAGAAEVFQTGRSSFAVVSAGEPAPEGVSLSLWKLGRPVSE